MKKIEIPNIKELADNFEVQYHEHLEQEVFANSPESLQANKLARRNTAVLGFAIGAVANGLYKWLRDRITPLAIPTFSWGNYLDMWLESYGLARKQAISAGSLVAGQITGTGVAGTIIPEGTLFEYSDGTSYETITDATIPSSGQVTLLVQALQAGLVGNRLTGDILTMTSQINTVESDFLVVSLSGGADIETDAQARYRLKQRLSSPPLAGAPNDYVRWALSVPGITRAWCVRNPSGPCTVGVYIMADNNAPYGLPTESQRQAVFDYIRDDGRAPPDELFVIIPTPMEIDITLKLTPDNQKIRSNVEAELRDLFFREAEPNIAIPYTHLVEAVSIAGGEFTHEFVTPVITTGGSISPPQHGIPVIKSITFIV